MALRIALLVKALPLHFPGGQERHAWDLARGLAAKGHHVTVVTTAHPSGEKESQIDGVRIVHLSGTTPGRNSWGFFKQIGRWVAAHDGDFDVFHAQGFAALLANPKRTPLVTTVHGTVWSETPLARQVWPRLKFREMLAAMWRFKTRFLLSGLIRLAWKSSAVLLCDSLFTRGELLRIDKSWAEKIVVVPLGVSIPKELIVRRRDYEEHPLHLLCVGRLERVKGLEDAIAAVDQLRDHRTNFVLTIVGDGPHRAALERQVAESEATIRMLGRVDNETLAKCWYEADIFVNPEWSQPAFGLVSLEAMGWSLPVLATRVGATPEIVDETVGHLFGPEDRADLFGTLDHWARQPEEISKRAVEAYVRAAQFTVEQMVEGTLAAYGRIG